VQIVYVISSIIQKSGNGWEWNKKKFLKMVIFQKNSYTRDKFQFSTVFRKKGLNSKEKIYRQVLIEEEEELLEETKPQTHPPHSNCCFHRLSRPYMVYLQKERFCFIKYFQMCLSKQMSFIPSKSNLLPGIAFQCYYCFCFGVVFFFWWVSNFWKVFCQRDCGFVFVCGWLVEFNKKGCLIENICWMFCSGYNHTWRI